MKKIIITLSVLLVTLSLQAQNNSVKHEITGEIYTNITFPDFLFSYYGNIAYRLGKSMDLGINLGSYFPSNGYDIIAGIDCRFYILPFLYKRKIKTDLYLKGSWQYEWLDVKFDEYNTEHKLQKSHYSAYIGFRYYPFKRLGVTVESGYSSYFKYNANFGLIFKLKK